MIAEPASLPPDHRAWPHEHRSVPPAGPGAGTRPVKTIGSPDPHSRGDVAGRRRAGTAARQSPVAERLVTESRRGGGDESEEHRHHGGKEAITTGGTSRGLRGVEGPCRGTVVTAVPSAFSALILGDDFYHRCHRRHRFLTGGRAPVRIEIDPAPCFHAPRIAGLGEDPGGFQCLLLARL